MVGRLKSIFGNWRLLIPILFLAVGVVIGAKYGVEYWLYTMTHVYTDDARVKGAMVSLSPEVSGLVRKVHTDEGNEVKKGMVLIEIDQADYLTQLAQAEAACEARAARRRHARAHRTTRAPKPGSCRDSYCPDMPG